MFLFQDPELWNIYLLIYLRNVTQYCLNRRAGEAFKKGWS
ncbi:hypothetical protein ADICYQ_5881 [Cyclobacterium qasimii M12-11B]|uniref:Uncharacterized protein n=1 Tax=Cyclobacterium qasimii M12-11B TaxID=641524 RepID=S7V4U2_9BACT|nr:hypothetical protein ADICYQ_5881 [Cyclobacterium qasimii M12-11B]